MIIWIVVCQSSRQIVFVEVLELMPQCHSAHPRHIWLADVMHLSTLCLQMNLHRNDGKAKNTSTLQQAKMIMQSSRFFCTEDLQCWYVWEPFCSEWISTSGLKLLHGQQLMIAMTMFVVIAGMLLPLGVACARGNVSWVVVQQKTCVEWFNSSEVGWSSVDHV